MPHDVKKKSVQWRRIGFIAINESMTRHDVIYVVYGAILMEMNNELISQTSENIFARLMVLSAPISGG